MKREPPRSAQRLLLWALGGGDDARAVLGDLSEDFVRHVEAKGPVRAGVWFWWEAATLAVGVGIGRMLGRRWAGGLNGRRGVMSEFVSRVGVVQDARYAVRAIRRDPGFFVFATLIIGLGVGASTAVFSVMSPLLLQPLPFDQPEQLTWVANTAGEGLSGVTSRTSNLRDFRAQSRSFEGMTGYNAFFEQSSYNLVGSGEPERLIGVGVADDFLDVLGVTPLVGRGFVPQEGLWDGRPAVILTHGFWMRRFAGDRSIVGRSITLNDLPREVVGVLPPSFDFASVFTPTVAVDILVPWPVSDETDQWGNTTSIIGRLAPGATVASAQAELDAIMAGLQEADPERWGLAAEVTDLQTQIARPFRAGMLLLAAAAGLVMLIVCVNLSNMLLARSPRRRREMAIRRTMGATRGRLVRQLLGESVVVSLTGAVVGLGVAYGATRFVSGTRGLEIPMLSAVQVDLRALAFTLALAVLAGLLVGVVPALQVAEGGEAEALSGSSRGSTSGRAGRRLRELLVVAEVAMACVLLVFGGLVLKSFQRVMDVDLGFEPASTVAWQLNSSRDFETDAARMAFYEDIVQGVSAVPGVASAALTDALPLGRNRTWGSLRVVGVELEADEDRPSFFPHLVDHRYLSTMRIPLVRGRGFTADDDGESAPVAIVSETAERLYFPDGDAMGQFISMWYGDVEVVGVVQDVRHRSLDIGGDPEVYFPIPQLADFGSLDMVVRTELPPESVTGPVGAAIRSVDGQMPVEDSWTLDSLVERSVSPRRFTLQLLGAFAVSALLLAALGIYGVLSYSVTERIPEIGIRMALGESAAEVRRGVVGRTLVLAGIGVAVGLVVSLIGSRMISSLLFGVEPNDPVTFVSMVAVLLAVATISGLIPAVRASRTDSAGALRSAT